MSHWIQTLTGRAFDPLTATVDDLQIEEIAHAMGNTCRFNGHCDPYYSTAEHCVRMSYAVQPSASLWALLHDGAEPLTKGDIPSPFKNDHDRVLENRVLDLIRTKWCPDLTEADASEVHTADLWMVYEEASRLLGPAPKPWSFPQPFFTPRHRPFQWLPNVPAYLGWEPRTAGSVYLRRFRELHNAHA